MGETRGREPELPEFSGASVLSLPSAETSGVEDVEDDGHGDDRVAGGATFLQVALTHR